MPGEDAGEAAEEARMQATLVNAMAQSGPVDMSPAWIKSVLLEANHDKALVEKTVNKMIVHRKLQEALLQLATSVTRMNTFEADAAEDRTPLGYATEERLRPLLEEKGLTTEQVALALDFVKKQSAQNERPAPQNGGYVVASDAETGNPLWCVQVYETNYSSGFEKDNQEIFITELSQKDGQLLVKDEADRTHTIDLSTKEVCKLN